MTRTLLILLALLLLVVTAVFAVFGVRDAYAQESATPAAGELRALSEALGIPARPAAVRRLVRGALRVGDPQPALLAEALGLTGGHAALEGVTQLLRDRDPTVRVAALDAASRIGLRSARAATVVFRAAAEGSGRERLAAIVALGVVGDGRDVDLLLDHARSEDADARHVAFEALRRLADVPIPPVHARWAWHWRVLMDRADAGVVDALERLDEEPDGRQARSLRAELRRHAWVRLQPVDTYVDRWLRSEDRAKRALACWLAAELRLADHAPAIVRARAHAVGEDDLAREARRALQVLGGTQGGAP